MLHHHLAFEQRCDGVAAAVDGDLGRLIPAAMVDAGHPQLVDVLEPRDGVGVELGRGGSSRATVLVTSCRNLTRTVMEVASVARIRHSVCAVQGSLPPVASLHARGCTPPKVQRTWFLTDDGRYG